MYIQFDESRLKRAFTEENLTAWANTEQSATEPTITSSEMVGVKAHCLIGIQTRKNVPCN